MIPYEPYPNFYLYNIPISIHFITAIIATLFGIIIFNYDGLRKGLARHHLVKLSIYGTLAQLILARVFYFLGPWSWHNEITIIQRVVLIFTASGGMVLYGGVIGIILCTFIYCKHQKLPVWKYFDSQIIALPAVLVIARFGCFAANDAFGIPTALPWGITRLDWNAVIHPTEIYHSVAAVILLTVISFLRYRSKFEGFIFLWTVTLYALFRFIIEFFRYYFVNPLGLTPSQIVSILWIIIFVPVLLNKYRKEEYSPPLKFPPWHYFATILIGGLLLNLSILTIFITKIIGLFLISFTLAIFLYGVYLVYIKFDHNLNWKKILRD